MKIPAPLNALSLLGKSLGLGLFIFSSAFAATQPKYDSTIWIPVIFYDFHPNTYNDFEMCRNPGGAPRTADNPQGSVESKGMVESNISSDRKPVMTPIACNSATPTTFPCACSLDDWFKPSGIGTSSTVKFDDYDSTINGTPVKLWRWEGLTRSTQYSTATDEFFVGPSWNANDTGANLVYYSSLPFVLTDASTGTYSFDRRSSQGTTRPNNPFFWLDGKGFGNEPSGRNHNFAFTMELHHEFTYQGGEKFNFSGDDDVWVFINNKLVIDLGGVHNEMSAEFELNDIATEYGLVKNEKYYLDVFYAERHTTESNCFITTNLIRPTIKEFDIKVDGNSACPGEPLKLTGTVIDRQGNPMPELEDSINWVIVQKSDTDPNDKLIEKKGKVVHLLANKGWRIIEVKASVYDPYIPEITHFDSVFIPVIPCDPHHIVIEASENPHPTDSNPLPSINIGPNQTEWVQCYAVVRDSFGNLYDTNGIKKFTSSNTEWTSDNIQIATVSGETNKAYHGIVIRVNNGDTKVTASDGDLIPDDVPVHIANHYPDSLRLVDLKTNKVVDILRLETDSVGNYKIQGHKSTSGSDYGDDTWEDISAKLQLLDTLKSTTDTSLFTHKWDYSPINHGRGHVDLTNPNDTRTPKTVIPVIITLSPPQFKLTLITPEAQRIAGDTLLVEVLIENTDGPIPIAYCFNKNGDLKDSISYFENLGRGGEARPEPPFVIVDGVKTTLNFDNDRYRNGQCFAPGGRDTIKMVLFYAPFNPGPDSLHTLSLTAGPRSAKTEPFKLLPGPLYTLKFEDQNGIPYPDPHTMNYKNEVFSTYSNGYDKYGNRRGDQMHEFSEWSVTGDLDPAKLGDKFGDWNTYTTLNETDGREGKLIAQAKGINDSMIVAELTIIVGTPPSPVTLVYTRDISGNGLLDRVDLTFNKRTNFSLDDGNIVISNVKPVVNFSIDSIVPAPNGGDSVYYIYLQETADTIPQTAWTPTLILTGFSEVENYSGVITDGAAPVVWKAEKNIISAQNRKKDIVTITLSEQIETGGSLGLVTIESNPPDVFRIWEKVNGEYVIEDLLKDIDNFNKIDDTIFEFTMKNGREITDGNYVNIIYQNKLIADENSNYTHERNQKVKFKIIGEDFTVTIIPNPARPTAREGQPGKLELIEKGKKDAFDLVNRSGGAIIKITAIRPSDTTKLKITLKVYDVVGNQVIWAKNDDVFKDHYNTDTSNIAYLYYYWNCTNARGMKVAPGTYKLIAWFEYNSPGYKNPKPIPLIMGVKK